jgi:Zn finger protein HypA/HybF involved in hydrogenase expression
MAACAERAAGRRVELVRVRHATTIPADALRQAFAMLAEGGSLDGATLETEPFDVVLDCGCGFRGALGHDDLVEGSAMAICPACGAISTLRRTAELELVEVVTSG